MVFKLIEVETGKIVGLATCFFEILEIQSEYNWLGIDTIIERIYEDE